MSLRWRTVGGFTLTGLLAGLVVSLLAGDTKPPADWPVFRGNPLQTGVAAATLPEKLEVLWKIKTKDSVESTAAIVEDTVYVGSFDEHLYALDLATGKEKWKYKAGPIKAPPSLRDGLVYVGDGDGLLHCVYAKSGEKRWTFETGAEITSGVSFAGDNILFGSGDETLYCLSKYGKEQWKFKVPGGPVLGTPAVVNGHTFAAGCDSTLHVLNSASGKEVGATVDLGGQVGATVAVVGDNLYVGTMSSQVLAVNWKKGEILWKFEAAGHRQPFFSSAAATDKLAIVGSRDKRVYALDRQSGQEVWSFPTRKKVDSSPVIVGQRVFVGSSDGNLYVLDLDKGAELQKFALGSAITASPAVGGNCLVIGTTDGTVYCLGPKK